MKFKRGEIKKSLFSALIISAIIALLVLSGPAEAVKMKISTEDDGSSNGRVTFNVEFDVQDGERVPVQNLTLHIKNSTGEVKTCTFMVNGTPISGCSNLKITPIALGQQGDFGYGFNFGNGTGSDGLTTNTIFGYGYGYDRGKFKYKIKWKTKDEVPALALGKYKANLEAFAMIDGISFRYFTKKSASFTIKKKGKEKEKEDDKEKEGSNNGNEKDD